MIYTLRDWKDFLQGNPKPTTVETLMHLGQCGVRAKCFTDVKFDKIELDVVAKWEDTSFAHDWNGGGVEQQGYWEVFEIFYNDTMLPLALISDETIQKLLDLINQPKGRA